MPGGMIPLAWTEALPEWTQEVYAEQTVWQWLLVAALLLVTTGAGFWAVRWSRSASAGEKSHPRRAFVGPLTIAGLAALAGYLINTQFGVTGFVYTMLQTVFSTVFFLAAAWSYDRPTPGSSPPPPRRGRIRRGRSCDSAELPSAP